MGAFVGIFVDLRGFNERMGGGLRAVKSLAPALRLLRSPARADQRDHGKKAEGPGGQNWPGLARSTLERRAADGRAKRLAKAGRVGKRKSRRRRVLKQRKLLGRLPSLWDSKVDAMSLTLTHKVRWAIVHLKGGRAGHGARIPGRDFAWWSDEMIARARDTLGRHCMEGFGK